MNQLLSLRAIDQALAISQGQTTSVELVSAHIDRIEQVNPQLHAVITVDAEGALALARAADESIVRGDAVGPLHGVPFNREGWNALERELIDDIRWWTLGELTLTTDGVFPPGLARRLPAILEGRLPAEPERIPWR